MTKEEAIHILRDSKPSTIMKEGKVVERVANVCIAIDIAIESLEHIPCYLDSPCEYQNPDIKIPRCVTLTEEAYSDLCLRASHERKTGKWIPHYSGYRQYNGYDCSLCGGWCIGQKKYCGECGAKMEGAEE